MAKIQSRIGCGCSSCPDGLIPERLSLLAGCALKVVKVTLGTRGEVTGGTSPGSMSELVPIEHLQIRYATQDEGDEWGGKGDSGQRECVMCLGLLTKVTPAVCGGHAL